MRMISQIIQVGDDYAVIIPKKIVDKFSWKVGDEVLVTYDEKTYAICISKVTQT